MSQKGLELTAKIFSIIQETRGQLIDMGMTKNPINKQYLLLAAMLEEMKDHTKDQFSTISVNSLRI